MKRFYLKFRIALMTFALGLASVFILNGTLKISDEIQVNLPEVRYEPSTIFFSLTNSPFKSPNIFSIEKRIDPKEGGAGASGGVTCDEARKRAKNKNIKIENCD